MKKKKVSVLNGKIQKVMVGRTTAAEMFDTSAGYLANLFSQGRGPRVYKVNRKCLYDVNDLLDFFKACPIATIDSHDCNTP